MNRARVRDDRRGKRTDVSHFNIEMTSSRSNLIACTCMAAVRLDLIYRRLYIFNKVGRLYRLTALCSVLPGPLCVGYPYRDSLIVGGLGYW